MTKRRLPVLKISTDAESAGPARPARQWIAFGAAAIFAAWVPLSSIAAAISARVLARAADASALGRAVWLTNALYAAELALGAVAGGYLLGRWGPVNVRARESAAAGGVAALAAVVAASVPSGPVPGLAVVAILAPLAAGLGGALGLRARTRRA